MHNKNQGVYSQKIFHFCSLVSLISFLSCTSGSDSDVRNKNIFDEAKQNLFQNFTTSAYTFDGEIDAAIDLIDNIAPATGDTAGASAIADTTIEGIVTIPSDYSFASGTNECTAQNKVYLRSFVLQDQNAGILVAYGLEPPLLDTAQSASMKYINNARTPNMAVFGDRIRLTATRAMYYGSGGNVIPVITDFKNVQIISSRNPVAVTQQAAAFTRVADLFRARQLEGYVKVAPGNNIECVSGDAREFQFKYQTGYVGQLCVNATSASDADTCTGGSKFVIKFQLSKNLGAGTLSGFDLGDMFSYTLAKGAKVRMRGPIGSPLVSGAEADLTLMLGQKFQVETLQ